MRSDYKSLTALQQRGHASGGTTARSQAASFTEVRSSIEQQKADLRSSHFALGVDRMPFKASSAAMFTPPPQAALLGMSTENAQARERIQRSNFSIKDGTSKNLP